MNLIMARSMVDHLKTIQTQEYKKIVVGFIHKREDVKQYGGFCVRIIDTRTDEIVEYYKLTHYNYKGMREEVRTDFTRVYRRRGHIFYDTTGLN